MSLKELKGIFAMQKKTEDEFEKLFEDILEEELEKEELNKIPENLIED